MRQLVREDGNTALCLKKTRTIVGCSRPLEGWSLASSGGALFALDADTGQELWRVALSLGEWTMAPPISFALDGRQEIAVLAGNSLIVFGL